MLRQAVKQYKNIRHRTYELEHFGVTFRHLLSDRFLYAQSAVYQQEISGKE
jgi:chromosome segregation and condensation protein ScpB